jgi:hypothetical protein
VRPKNIRHRAAARYLSIGTENPAMTAKVLSGASVEAFEIDISILLLARSFKCDWAHVKCAVGLRTLVGIATIDGKQNADNQLKSIVAQNVLCD